MACFSVLGEGTSRRLQSVGDVNRLKELRSRYVVVSYFPALAVAPLSSRRYRPTPLDAISVEPVVLLIVEARFYSVRKSSAVPTKK
ncbi:hypothetical protein F2Q68_00010301 [Brassica cretica]|uniref:Uncharacterized protein n=1 Tax=Brassica cretica TaxID=69181 RepID=A0A8S9KTK9_BRACR|nr:hypothetical protein F2Q68_00010301 [Brassica cretica]